MKKASQPRWPWFGPWSDDGGDSAGPGESGYAASLDEIEAPVLPGLEPLKPLTAGELRDRLAASRENRADHRRPVHVMARIVDDSLDGTRVFALPPLRPHPVSRLRRLMDRMRPGVWMAVVLAALTVAAFIAEQWPLGHWTPDSMAEFLMRLAGVTAPVLLPAGVLLWRPDAWRSARLVLVGSIVWGAVPAMAFAGWWVSRHFATLRPAAPAMTALLAAVSVAACCGPAIMAFGLERARQAHDSQVRYLATRAGLLAAFFVGMSAAQWNASQAGAILPAIGPGDSAPFLVLLRGGTLPFEIGSLSLLAYVCVSAAIDGNPQPSLWRLASIGVVLLAMAAIWELVAAHLFANAWMPAFGGEMDAWGPLMGVAQIGGSILLLAAFSSPVWSLARDAAPGLGAPEEVFAWGSAADATGQQEVPIGAVVAVAAGADHALALDAQGRVAAWGDDSAGQTDVPPGLRGVRAVAAGDRFSLALRSDGAVVAWGSNDLGQATPPADLTAKAICAGADFGLALRADGTVVAWGNPASPAVEVPEDLRDVIAIAAGKRHALALRSKGSLVAWGDDESDQLRLPGRLTDVTAISAGGDFSLALRSDGGIVAWGDNTYGQLEVPATLHGVIAIAAGAYHGGALTDGGAVVSWGSGRMEGEGSHPWRLLDFRAVAAGHEYSLAIRAA